MFSVSAIGTFMATFEGSILNVALPTISDALHVPIDIVAWLVLAYTLTVISLMLLFGVWTESRGYAFAYRFGFSFFLLGSLICVLSPSIYVLIIGRVVEGIGTAMFAAVGPALVTTIFPRQEHGKGLGLTVMMVSAGFTLGPVVGGLLLSAFTWHSIFLINMPIGILGIFLTNRYFKTLPVPGKGRDIPILAGIAVATALVTAVYGLTQVKEHPLSDPHVWGFLAVSAVGFAVFLWLESRPSSRLIGLSIFKNRIFSLSIAAQQLYFVSSASVAVLLPFYLERVKGFEPRQVGLFLVIVPIMLLILAPLSGRLSDRIGFRWLTAFGMLTSAAGLYLLSHLDVDSTDLFIATSFMVIGAGAGIFSPPNSSAMMGSVTPHQRPTASAILATSRNMGMSMGVAVSATLFTYFEARHLGQMTAQEAFVEGYHPVILFAAAVAVVGVAVCLFRGDRRR
jgi:EmrB/QacA subfamily drug resistance transporter